MQNVQKYNLTLFNEIVVKFFVQLITYEISPCFTFRIQFFVEFLYKFPAAILIVTKPLSYIGRFCHI
jgi:hypothetical protein